MSTSAIMSSVLINTGEIMRIINSRLTSIVLRSKYRVRCVLPGLVIMSLVALQSPNIGVGPFTIARISSRIIRTAMVSLAARDATAVSASAVLSGTIRNFLDPHDTAPLHNIITYPPNGEMSLPQELS